MRYRQVADPWGRGSQPPAHETLAIRAELLVRVDVTDDLVD